MQITRALVMFSALALTGCQATMYGTASDLNVVKLGMERSVVIQLLGNPSSVSATDGIEFLTYTKMPATMAWAPEDYYVAIRDGHVISYGKKGDFGTTRDPALNLNIHTTSDAPTAAAPAPTGDTVDKLSRLYDLKQKGAITQEEYEREKAALLSH